MNARAPDPRRKFYLLVLLKHHKQSGDLRKLSVPELEALAAEHGIAVGETPRRFGLPGS